MEPDSNPNILERAKTWYRALPDKKRYVEFITAILTVPVLLTVLYANIQNLQRKPETGTTPAPISPATGIPTVTPATTPAKEATSGSTIVTPTPTPNPMCKKNVGPVSIASPSEGAVVHSGPVSVDIARGSDEYCVIVWSYRINGGSWSEYTDKSIDIYGLTPGNKTLDVRVKSVVSGDQVVLTRAFTVSGETPTPQSTGSGTPE